VNSLPECREFHNKKKLNYQLLNKGHLNRTSNITRNWHQLWRNLLRKLRVKLEKKGSANHISVKCSPSPTVRPKIELAT
jgi:hypothetical protein